MDDTTGCRRRWLIICNAIKCLIVSGQIFFVTILHFLLEPEPNIVDADIMFVDDENDG